MGERSFKQTSLLVCVCVYVAEIYKTGDEGPPREAKIYRNNYKRRCLKFSVQTVQVYSVVVALASIGMCHTFASMCDFDCSFCFAVFFVDVSAFIIVFDSIENVHL